MEAYARPAHSGRVEEVHHLSERFAHDYRSWQIASTIKKLVALARDSEKVELDSTTPDRLKVCRTMFTKKPANQECMPFEEIELWGASLAVLEVFGHVMFSSRLITSESSGGVPSN